MMIDLDEIWRYVKGYEGLYQISNYGRLKRLPSVVKRKYAPQKHSWILIKSKIKKPTDLKGYLTSKLCKNGKSTRFYIHRLVAETFIPNPENKPEVNHKDGNKQNNRVDNLEWVTHQENCKHRDDNKLRKAPSGENHYLYGKHIKFGNFKTRKELEG